MLNARRRTANYEILDATPYHLVIRDIGPWDKYPTITNDAENVVAELAEQLAGRMLLYFDSEGELSRLRVREGRFAGFEPVP
jgi:hypothetical protein